MYDFKKDFEMWQKYAFRFHSRNILKQDFYCFTQSFVEKRAHLEVSLANVDRNRVLEIGGGGGEHVAFEKNNGLKNYIVIDNVKDFLDIVKKQYSITAMAADGCELPFKDDTFSVCIATSVFEHVTQLEKMLLEIKRVLVKDGNLLVIVPVNGNIVIEIYKLLISYPFMVLNGIKRPGNIWNYLNVNSFKRIKALLDINFGIIEKHSIPFKFVPTALSPLYYFHCKNIK